MKEIDIFYIFDKDDNLINTATNIKEYVLKKQTNGIGELKISSPLNSNFVKYNKIGFFVEDKFNLFEIDKVEADIYASEELYDVIALEDVITLQNNMIEERRMRDATLREGLEKALAGSGYKIGHIDDNKELRTYNYYFKNSLECLNILLKEYAMEFVARVELTENNRLEKFIDVYFRVGRETGLRFVYDINLQMLERTETNAPHFNVLYGFGKSLETENGGFTRKLTFDSVNNDKKYVEDTESILKYGRRVGKFEDGKIEDARELLNATKAKLKELKDLQYTYKATVKEVSDFLNLEHFEINSGDYAIILDEERDSIFESRVIEVTYIKDTRGVLNKKFTFGALSAGLFDDSLEDKVNDLNDRVDQVQNQRPELPPLDEQYPNTVPPKSNVKVTGLYSSIAIEWTFENKSYFWYELYASKQNNFVPQPTDLIFKGQASSYLHQVSPGETWYYRVRCVNSYGNANMFSEQVTGHSFKVSDATVFFEDMAIKHALIESLDMDKAVVGKLRGHLIEAKNLEVIDGNEKTTFKVDSFGRVFMDVTSLKISSKNVTTEEDTINKISTAINNYKKEVDKEFTEVNNAHEGLIEEMNGAFRDGIIEESETKAINERLVSIEKENADIEKEFAVLYNNANLESNIKNDLLNKKNSHKTAYTNLKNSITNAISDRAISDIELVDINNKTMEYQKAFSDLKEVFSRAIDNIGTTKVNTVNKKVDNMKFGTNNIILNSGMRKNSDGIDLSGGVTRDESKKTANGNVMAKHEKVNGQEASWLWNCHWLPIEKLEVGAEYTLSCTAYVEELINDGNVTLEIKCWDESGNKIGGKIHTIFTKENVREWKTSYVTTVIPPNTKSVQAGVWLFKNGRCWTGELCFVKGNVFTGWNMNPNDQVAEIETLDNKVIETQKKVNKVEQEVTADSIVNKVASSTEINRHNEANLLKNSLPSNDLEWRSLNGRVAFVSSDTQLKIHIIDTKQQADAILIQENGKNILVDCGYNSTINTVIEYLKNNGVSEIDLFIATHAHTDHVGGIEAICNNFVIKEAIVKEADWSIIDKIEDVSWGTSMAHRKMLQVFNEKGIKYREPKAFDVFKISDYGELRLINTKNYIYDEYNTLSIGVLYKHYNNKIFLASDMTKTSEKFCAGEIGEVNVLKVGHHGANGSNSELYLNEIKPQYGLITTMDIDHVDRKDALGCLQWKGVKMYDTQNNGTFVITSTKNSLHISNLNKEYKVKNSWWHRRDVGDFREWVYYKSDGSIARNEVLNIGGGDYEFDEFGICKNPY